MLDPASNDLRKIDGAGGSVGVWVGHSMCISERQARAFPSWSFPAATLDSISYVSNNIAKSWHHHAGTTSTLRLAYSKIFGENLFTVYPLTTSHTSRLPPAFPMSGVRLTIAIVHVSDTGKAASSVRSGKC